MKQKEEKIVQSFEEQNNKNKQLVAAVTMYRYKRELAKIDSAMEANRPMPTHNKSKVGRAIIDGTLNAYRRNEMQKLSDKKKKCRDNITALEEKCKNEGIVLTDSSEESLRQLAASVFLQDTHGLQKICFAMLLCLQGEEEKGQFLFGDETLNDVSLLLFDDELRIQRIQEKFYENFKEITDGSFWERNKYFLIGTGISLALVTVLTPLALGVHAASSAVITSCLAQIGHSAPGIIGAGMASVTGMAFLGTAVLGGVALAGLGIGELVKAKQAKEIFRNLRPTDVAALLAMKATLFDFSMSSMDDESCKKELDACLSGLNDFRADAEYMLIVEKCDADSSKKKIQICNRFVNRLASIAGI